MGFPATIEMPEGIQAKYADGKKMMEMVGVEERLLEEKQARIDFICREEGQITAYSQEELEWFLSIARQEGEIHEHSGWKAQMLDTAIALGKEAWEVDHIKSWLFSFNRQTILGGIEGNLQVIREASLMIDAEREAIDRGYATGWDAFDAHFVTLHVEVPDGSEDGFARKILEHTERIHADLKRDGSLEPSNEKRWSVWD